jgi:hypothetical protein
VLAKEKVDKIGVRLNHTSKKLLKCLAPETSISESLNPHLNHEVNSNI